MPLTGNSAATSGELTLFLWGRLATSAEADTSSLGLMRPYAGRDFRAFFFGIGGL